MEFTIDRMTAGQIRNREAVAAIAAWKILEDIYILSQPIHVSVYYALLNKIKLVA